MNISTGNLSFKSIQIKDGGLNFIENNDGIDAVTKLADTESKYKNYHWNLIINRNGYSLHSPVTKKHIQAIFLSENTVNWIKIIISKTNLL